MNFTKKLRLGHGAVGVAAVLDMRAVRILDAGLATVHPHAPMFGCGSTSLDQGGWLRWHVRAEPPAGIRR